MKRILHYFTKYELALWTCSVLLTVLSFLLFDRKNPTTLIASLIGVTSLIFCAKGNPVGQILMIVFSLIYGFISFSFAYYGEMITYLCMTLPMAVFSLIAWLRHPFKGNRSQVAVHRITKKELLLILLLSAVVTAVLYYVLKHFNTANLLPSTLSVTTSFIAAALTLCRSPYFALAYAANDLVLIVMWILASTEDLSYLSVVICFAVFLANDLYGFFNWIKMQKKQLQNT